MVFSVSPCFNSSNAFASWCGPCKLISPILKKVISASDKTVLVLVNVDEAQEVSTKHQIMSLPTIAAFKDGVIVEQVRFFFLSVWNL